MNRPVGRRVTQSMLPFEISVINIRSIFRQQRRASNRNMTMCSSDSGKASESVTDPTL